MLKNEGCEIKESGIKFALTIVLTKFLLASVVGASFWLVQTILDERIRLPEIARGFNQF